MRVYLWLLATITISNNTVMASNADGTKPKEKGLHDGNEERKSGKCLVGRAARRRRRKLKEIQRVEEALLTGLKRG